MPGAAWVTAGRTSVRPVAVYPLPRRRHNTAVVLSASSLYRIVTRAFGPALAAVGFRPVDRRTWLRRSKHLIREIVSFVPPGSYLGISPLWGLSLDDVPHASYRTDYRVSWNSAEADCPLDLVFDPLEFDWHNAEARWCISKVLDPDAAGVAAEKVKRRTMDAAMQFFGSVTTISDLPTAFELKRSTKPVRWGASAGGRLLPQEQLAYAFTLRRLGRSDEGRGWLEAFISHDPLMPRRVRQELCTWYETPPAPLS